MRYFPIFLDLEGKRVLAVGGGEPILGKVRLLQRTSAAIELVADKLHPALDGLVSHGAVAWVGRRFQADHLDGIATVFVSADEATNHAVVAAARARNIPVNIVDRPELSSFIVPAIVDRDPLIVAIGSEGTGPVLAQGVRARIEAMLPYRLGELARRAAGLRERVAAAVSAAAGRREFWARFFFGPVADAFFSGDERLYAATVDDAIAEAASPRAGRVSFLAVPADPELLTLKAHRKLQEADIIVHDRPGDPSVLDYARRDAARLAVDGADPELLVGEAKKGRYVVRLRSQASRLAAGSARELSALAAAGISVDVIPGQHLAEAQTEWRAAS